MPPSEGRAALVLVGDELLNGSIEDHNGVWLLRQLRALGTATSELHVVPDDVERIAEALNLCRHRNQHVLVSGGIGPTHDDVTLAGVAAALGVPLVPCPALLAHVRRRFAHDSAHLAGWERMCFLPEGASLVWGEGEAGCSDGSGSDESGLGGSDSDESGLGGSGFGGGTGSPAPPVFLGSEWPTYRVGNVYVFPGSPPYLHRQFEAIARRFRGPGPLLKAELLLDREEGELAEWLAGCAARHPGVGIGSYPALREGEGFRVKLALHARDPDALAAALADLRAWLPDARCAE
jgi:molybdenum cofactor synthesis domain-containing protein